MEPLFKNHEYGITPAYAGKSDLRHAYLKGAKDHPRIRGKKAIHRFNINTGLGSPPHTREKVK